VELLLAPPDAPLLPPLELLPPFELLPPLEPLPPPLEPLLVPLEPPLEPLLASLGPLLLPAADDPASPHAATSGSGPVLSRPKKLMTAAGSIGVVCPPFCCVQAWRTVKPHELCQLSRE
jgi:hypothetical protein